MLDVVMVIMLFIFLIMFVSNLYLNNPFFGMVAGFWLIITALAILVDGIQLQSGMNIVTVGGNTTISYSYTDLVLPFPSTASVIFGVFLIGLSIYIVYKNAEDLV
jgi:hypothetical protein